MTEIPTPWGRIWTSSCCLSPPLMCVEGGGGAEASAWTEGLWEGCSCRTVWPGWNPWLLGGHGKYLKAKKYTASMGEGGPVGGAGAGRVCYGGQGSISKGQLRQAWSAGNSWVHRKNASALSVLRAIHLLPYCSNGAPLGQAPPLERGPLPPQRWGKMPLIRIPNSGTQKGERLLEQGEKSLC